MVHNVFSIVVNTTIDCNKLFQSSVSSHGKWFEWTQVHIVFIHIPFRPCAFFDHFENQMEIEMPKCFYVRRFIFESKLNIVY